MIKKESRYTSAVILAAGVGSRFGNENGTKQNALVSGIPAVVRTVLAFEECETVDEIILVGREAEMDMLRSYVNGYSLKKVSKLVVGGDTRMESSLNGASAVSDRCVYVAIHDGARCLVTADIIDTAVRAAYGSGAAAAAQRVVDTVKLADEDESIEATVDREKVWLVKTPQVFLLDMYKKCAESARADGVSVTDDCMMAERLGYKIKLCDCGQFNIKLTTREDLALAEFILSQREKASKKESIQ